MRTEQHIEIDFCQTKKNGENALGDVFLSHKDKEQSRIIAVLSDGLGSGIKANVLATLTSSMALRFISNFKDIKKTAEIIMQTLPVCKTRKISYSTFTILDIGYDGEVRIMEYDNPSALLIRSAIPAIVERKDIKLGFNRYKEHIVKYSHFNCKLNDRIIFFTDGVSQSGIGTEQHPTGWGEEAVCAYAVEQIKADPEISARDLAVKIVNKANLNFSFKPQDDISCAVVYFRKPRKTLIATGPPFSKEKDRELASTVKNFNGKKIVCGGTTAHIIAREWGQTLNETAYESYDGLPPESELAGIDITAEGVVTLNKTAQILKEGAEGKTSKNNPAVKIAQQLMNSDVIEFLVGSRISEVFQDPNISFELEIRRNLIKNIASILEEKYLKETHIKFI
ncbi:MAG TPA: SpoIIE family protein phosphatase [Ignavibacteriales bacterium]|nr:SpoIIE family protein phosphatase [Ignavibacteriales bacterium]